jgi:CTD small phosphatase-like protein 2
MVQTNPRDPATLKAKDADTALITSSIRKRKTGITTSKAVKLAVAQTKKSKKLSVVDLQQQQEPPAAAAAAENNNETETGDLFSPGWTVGDDPAHQHDPHQPHHNHHLPSGSGSLLLPSHHQDGVINALLLNRPVTPPIDQQQYLLLQQQHQQQTSTDQSSWTVGICADLNEAAAIPTKTTAGGAVTPNSIASLGPSSSSRHLLPGGNGVTVHPLAVHSPDPLALSPVSPQLEEDEEEDEGEGKKDMETTRGEQQQQQEEEVEEECFDFDPYVFIKTLPPLEHCVTEVREPLLPPPTHQHHNYNHQLQLHQHTTRRVTRYSSNKKPKTLVLDLDETLVHSTLEGYVEADFTFPVEVGQTKHLVMVRQRPHLHTFLERASKLFEIVVFTASQKVYAEQLLDIIDPQGKHIRHRVYRDSCVFWEGNYLKDLTVLGRDLAHTLIVDNSPQAFGFQLDNGVPIESWYDDDDDDELLKLIPFLEDVARADDVRPLIREKFKLRELVDSLSVLFPGAAL